MRPPLSYLNTSLLVFLYAFLSARLGYIVYMTTISEQENLKYILKSSLQAYH